MENITLSLTLIWGVFLLAWAAIFTIYPGSKYAIINFSKRPKMNYFFGVIALGIGLLHVQYHNIWEYDISLVITLFGWIFILKGIFLILDPYALYNANVIAESKYFKYFLVVMYFFGFLFILTWLSYY